MSATSFGFRALELHSTYAWDMAWVRRGLDFIRANGLTALVLHRNDIVDQMVYPGRLFGAVRDNRNIFERYQEIHRALYRYTPTRRSGPYLRRDYLRRVVDLAARQGTEVWFQNKELSFHDVFLEFNPHLVKGGTICPNEPFWWSFLDTKYTELFQELPGLAGVITAPGTGESRLAISSNRCGCERCRGVTPAEWYGKLIRAMHAPIRAAGRTLAVRDFVFDRAAHDELGAAMQALPADIIVSLKNTPHDYYPTFPDNPRLGRVGARRQWIEYDCMGQYFGWGIAPAIMTADLRRRLDSAAAAGADGVILRTDWESLDGHSVFHTPNMITLHAGAALARDREVDDATIYAAWLRGAGMLAEDATPDGVAAAAAWAERLLGGSWEITRRTLFTRDCVFSDATLYPVSLAHAWWLAEEKNSLKDWLPEAAEALATDEANVRRMLAEKDEALALVQALPARLANPPAALRPAAVADLAARIDVFIRYVRGFRVVGHALVLTRALLDHPAGAFAAELRALRPAAMQAVLDEAAAMDAFAAATDCAHVVYTLLSGERLRALHADLAERAA